MHGISKKVNTYVRTALLSWTNLQYPELRADLRKMIRDNYYARLLQSKFFIRDYLIRKPYKAISYNGEFQQELLFVLPFAYWHYANGTLSKTFSSKATKELYFFSPDHRESYSQRTVRGSSLAFHIPNMTHCNSFSYKKWKRVPLKQQYGNTFFVYEKPLLVIANKYNIEWLRPPINFLDIDTLDHIINACKDHYQIIYNRPQPKNIIEDNSEVLDLNEHDWLRRKHPEVILMDDLYAKYAGRVNNFNHLQLMVYANCSRFISTHGGTAALASYFGGTNIILSHPGWGREYLLGEYETIFPKLSGATIIHAHNAQDVVRFTHQYFLQSTHQSKAVWPQIQ